MPPEWKANSYEWMMIMMECRTWFDPKKKPSWLCNIHIADLIESRDRKELMWRGEYKLSFLSLQNTFSKTITTLRTLFTWDYDRLVLYFLRIHTYIASLLMATTPWVCNFLNMDDQCMATVARAVMILTYFMGDICICKTFFLLYQQVCIPTWNALAFHSV